MLITRNASNSKLGTAAQARIGVGDNLRLFIIAVMPYV